MLLRTFQKTVYCVAKGRLLRSKMPHIARRKTAFCKPWHAALFRKMRPGSLQSYAIFMITGNKGIHKSEIFAKLAAKLCQL